ncbi:G-protein-signaling modulator 2 [Trichoplax sp. H2]|nr:G-protein-signaling modulator 2 [Trichoplax sp. H2]|eukprot:RDD44386.1 G-protein-signaling modulator 2 [Trichoplax sp. H2]
MSSSSPVNDNLEKSEELSCIDLALEGERLCRAGQCRAGVLKFEGAVRVGTEDLKTLSAIYSQLGNAYFYLHEYEKALQYHRHDLTLARTLGDRQAEAKASGNLGNTLKVLGKFDEAILCAKRYLEISREIQDKHGESNALYNLGNIYHAKGKHSGRCGHHENVELPPSVKDTLEKAISYYWKNLDLLRELNDKSGQGRAYGNLGNTYYLLRKFDDAIKCHKERLDLAIECKDVSAERRAYSNLGNACVFGGDLSSAVEYYKKAHTISIKMNDKAIEAQTCYSLGNAYTLLRNFSKAIEMHRMHLKIAQALKDRVGEGRTHWSLTNCHQELDNFWEALTHAKEHLEIAKEIGDQTGRLTAQNNISSLNKILSVMSSKEAESSSNKTSKSKGAIKTADNLYGKENGKKLVKQHSEPLYPQSKSRASLRSSKEDAVMNDEVGLLDLIQRVQGSRLDEQRTKLPPQSREGMMEMVASAQGRRMDEQRTMLPTASDSSGNQADNAKLPGNQSEEMFDMLFKSQGKRLDEQRVSAFHLPGLNDNGAAKVRELWKKKRESLGETNSNEPDSEFFDMLMKCQCYKMTEKYDTVLKGFSFCQLCSLLKNVASRIDEQRVEAHLQISAPTVPDDDFFKLVINAQSGRMDEQRYALPEPGYRSHTGT